MVTFSGLCQCAFWGSPTFSRSTISSLPGSAEAHARLASCNLLSAALKLVDLQTAEGDATEEDDGEAGSEEGLHILGEGLVDTGGDCRKGERERE